MRNWEFVVNTRTKDGQEEYDFFIFLSRDPNHIWRPIWDIAKHTNLKLERVKEIIRLYAKANMVIIHHENSDLVAYWKRLPNASKQLTLTEEDHQKRMRLRRLYGS